MENWQSLRTIIDGLYALLLEDYAVDCIGGLKTADKTLCLLQMDITELRGEMQDQIRHIETINRQQGMGVG